MNASAILLGRLFSVNPDFSVFQKIMRVDEASPIVVVAMGGGILLLLLLVVVLELWRQRREMREKVVQQWKVFETLASAKGLEPTDIAFLREVHGGLDSLHSPDVLLRIPAVYDRALDAWLHGRALGDAEWGRLERLRRLLGFKGLTGETSLSHTRQMADGQVIRLAPEGGDEWFSAKVLANHEDRIVIQPDQPILWAPGSMLRLAFSRQGDGEYKASVPLVRKDPESTNLHIGHSAKLSRQQLRMWVRVSVYLEATMRELVDAEGRTLEPSTVEAHLLDLSGGGTMASTKEELPVECRGVLDFRLGETLVEGVRFIMLRHGKHAKDGSQTCHLCWDGIEIPAQERIMRFVFERQRLGGAGR